MTHVLNRKSKQIIVDFLVEQLKLSEEQAEIFVDSKDLELKKKEIIERLDNELATKDFVRAEISEFKSSQKVWNIIIVALILLFNPTTLEFVERLLALVK